MKFLFWILAILSIPIGLFVSFICYLGNGLDLACTVIGEVVFFLGMFSLVVSILCAVLGIIKLRKGNVKKALAVALIGIFYSAIMLAGFYLDEAAQSVLLDKEIAQRNDLLYGEGWNTPSAIDGIPALYQEELNKYYVAVRDQWPAELLVDLYAVSMADYYGDISLDNIGFILMDVNGDSSEELLIGTAAPVQEGGTAIFCVYSDPQNPFRNITSTEGETYYLHSAERNGTYMAEISGADAAWLLEAEEDGSIVGITYHECVLDPADRVTLEMIPFSQYK